MSATPWLGISASSSRRLSLPESEFSSGGAFRDGLAIVFLPEKGANMPLKLNVGASRKITDDHFGSRGASVNLEIELDSSLVGDSDKLQERIRHLFNLVRQSLAEELNGANGQHPPPRNASRQAAEPSRSANGAKSANGQSNGTGRLATPRQIKALYAITKQQGTDLHKLLRNRFDVEQPEELTLKAASSLIESLRSNAA
jgi:hypothetical protein